MEYRYTNDKSRQFGLWHKIHYWHNKPTICTRSICCYFCQTTKLFTLSLSVKKMSSPTWRAN